VLGYLKRLIRTGAAYQASDILSKGVALFTLPLYTRYVSKDGYGYVETLMVAVIFLSIVLRLGVGEAFIRFYYDDTDVARRDRIAAAAVAFVFVTTTIVAIAGLVFAGPLSHALLGVTNPVLIDFAMLGVVPYLTPEALSATWGFVGSGAKGSGIVFDYSIPPSAMSVVQRVVFEVMAARVAAAGEPWKMFFEPAHLANILKEHGFTRLEDLSGAAINARYFADREDKLQVRGVGRLMKAIT